MNQLPERPPVRISSPAGLIAVVPHLLGFTPQVSLVVIAVTPHRGRVKLTFRYDLPDPPDPAEAAAIAEHALGVLARHRVAIAVVIGYGPGPLVTPLADAIRQESLRASGLRLRDVLRVHEGRYWSYFCREPSCCPAEGVPLDVPNHPAAQAMTAGGMTALPDREALAATLAPVTGPDAGLMIRATRRAMRDAARLAETEGMRALDREGLSAVQAAITSYRNDQTVSRSRHAWLSVVLTRLPVRDDAWARMDPTHREAHLRLWTDLVRHAQRGYLAAPASLLAFTAWQSGNGALANIALDRALADTPGYSMAELIRQAVSLGVPPSGARLPMTPEEVAAAYADQLGD